MDTIYNRPLFRQMGGMAMPSPQEQMAMQQPMPMPQPMMSPEQIGEQMAQVESDAGAMGVGIGQELVNRMMQGLDSAETPKDLMDSIRGNDRSVDERRTELAEFVGEEDAEQTPETVLAMVQPTIMLTERGAMDSGVGELMEGVADVDMETMEGEPTDVGGGVASLMGVGQPPVQNFRNGGIVQKFQDGTEASFADYVRQASELTKTLYPAQDDYFKKMAMLNLANLGVTTGLGLASGRSPSGQPLSGNFITKAAQIGTEISPELTKSAMSLAQAKQAQEQKQKELAFKLGSDLYSKAIEEKIIPAGSTVMRAGKPIYTAPEKTKTPQFKSFQYVNPDTNELITTSFDVANEPNKLLEIQGFNPEEKGSTSYFVAKFPDGTSKNFASSTSLGYDFQANKFKEENANVKILKVGTDTKDAALKSKELDKKALEYLSNIENVDKYINAAAKDPKTGYAKEYTDVLYSYLDRNKEDRTGENVFGVFLQSWMKDYFKKAAEQGVRIDEALLNENLYVKPTKKDILEEDTTKEIDTTVKPLDYSLTGEPKVDYAAASGAFVPVVKDLTNKIVGVVNEFKTEVGMEASDIPFPNVEAAKNELQSLNTLTRNYFRQSGQRLLKDEFQKFEEQLPAAFGGTLEEQTAQLKRTKNTLETMKATLEKELTVKGITTQKRSDVTQSLVSIKPILKTYDKLVKAHEDALSLRKGGGKGLRRSLDSFKRSN